MSKTLHDQLEESQQARLRLESEAAALMKEKAAWSREREQLAAEVSNCFQHNTK
jgi:hypothetical protein